MPLILSGIHTLDQHLQTWLDDIDQYRPDHCPHCARSGLWSHGVYYRQARCEQASGNPVPIPRYICQHCKRTCSTLPEYISPRRWYHWFTQQLVLVLSTAGLSLMQIWQTMCDRLTDAVVPSICTLQRWLTGFKQRLSLHRFHLLNIRPSLGYAPGFDGFWQACLKEMSLSAAMLILNLNMDTVP